ncbi:MAG: DUF4394 domain-containing protein [Leptolyngbyaceae cyanobacterium CSU_1_3]|nr:DUF4394 domain-containing protein [Leptolyngbyaceae cyanobacterium CSU_1_3]
MVLEFTSQARSTPLPNVQIVGLAADNLLVSFNPTNPTKAQTLQIKGIAGTLIGIDVRPADGLLYGLTNRNQIYTINPTTGEPKLISTLSVPFNGGFRAGVDFNPVPDRLRLVNADGQNFRVNVDTGMVTVDKPLNYVAGDVNVSTNPRVGAAAYTNAFPGAPSPMNVTPPTRTTQLFDIDSRRDVLVLQNPPNDGGLQTIGNLGVDFNTVAGFDIFSPRAGENTAFAVSNSTLYTIDLASGSAKSMGQIGNGSFRLIGITVLAQ